MISKDCAYCGKKLMGFVYHWRGTISVYCSHRCAALGLPGMSLEESTIAPTQDNAEIRQDNVALIPPLAEKESASNPARVRKERKPVRQCGLCGKELPDITQVYRAINTGKEYCEQCFFARGS